VAAIKVADKLLLRHGLAIGVLTSVVALALPEWPWMSHTWWVEFAVGLIPAAGKVSSISVLPAVTQVVMTTGMLLAIAGALNFLIRVDAFFPRVRKAMRNVNGRRFQIAWRGTVGVIFCGLYLLFFLYFPLGDRPISMGESHTRGQMFVAAMTNSRTGFSVAAGTMTVACLYFWYMFFYINSLIAVVFIFPQRVNLSYGD